MICAYRGPDVLKEESKGRASVSLWFDDYIKMNTLLSKTTFCDDCGPMDAMRDGNMDMEDLKIITRKMEATCQLVSLYNIKKIYFA